MRESMPMHINLCWVPPLADEVDSWHFWQSESLLLTIIWQSNSGGGIHHVQNLLPIPFVSDRYKRDHLCFCTPVVSGLHTWCCLSCLFFLILNSSSISTQKKRITYSKPINLLRLYNWSNPDVLVFFYRPPKLSWRNSFKELVILVQSKATLKSVNIYCTFYFQDVS